MHDDAVSASVGDSTEAAGMPGSPPLRLARPQLYRDNPCQQKLSAQSGALLTLTQDSGFPLQTVQSLLLHQLILNMDLGEPQTISSML